ncbi:MAG: LysE family translocator, partial [Gemmobacter sp.]
MSLDWWFVLLGAAVAISLTPGPNALLSLDHGARFGLARAKWTIAGSVIGMVGLIVAAMAGLGALLAASETLFTAVKWIGAACLVWLGIRLWQAPGFAGRDDLPDRPTELPIGRGRAFATGGAVMLSNPKTILFFTTFLPQFMLPGASLAAQIVVVALTLAIGERSIDLVLAGG